MVGVEGTSEKRAGVKCAACRLCLQSVPRRARKVRIDGRFQSMFTSDRFKVACELRERWWNNLNSEGLFFKFLPNVKGPADR